MQFTRTNIPDAYIISLDPQRDERGFFARAWCQRELEEHGLCADVVQCNIGFSEKAGTVRGIHWQNEPHDEVKIVRCTRGGVFDVMVDVRPNSPTYGQHHAMELKAADRTLLYIPTGVGHGYQTLFDDSEVFYQTSQFYHAESCDGLRYNDPALAIDWPLEVSVIADRDLTWPDFALRSAAALSTEDPQ